MEVDYSPFPAPPPSAQDYIVGIDTSTFQPFGDERNLGVKVKRVELSLFNDPTLNLPPFSVILWSLITVVGLFGVFSPLHWRIPALPYSGVALIALLFLTNRLYAAILTPALGVTLGLLGLLVWQRERVRRWPEWVDALSHRRWSTVIMLGAMLLYAVVALWAIPQVDGIGHADYAENAVIARNLVSGKGLTVDYLAQFYKDPGPGLSHPADTWPLLQPLLIAPFFALFGPQTWAAKLPNLFVLLVLAWTVFVVARRLWDARVGLLGGLLTLVHPYFFNSVLYPINDLVFTLIFFVLAYLVWRFWILDLGFWNDGPPPGDPEQSKIQNPKSKMIELVAIGALAALLIWSKPSGAVLLPGLALAGFWLARKSPKSKIQNPKSAWRALALVGGAFALVILPLILRNMLAFGTPFFSTEGYDAWILRYWPYHDWEDIYKVYFGAELPHPRWVVGGKFGYENLVDAVVRGFQSLWRDGVVNSSSADFVIGSLPLVGALVGLAACPRRVRSLFALVGLSLGLYALFVLLYWHFEGRYFQVVVPWVYMLLAWGAFWLWDRLREFWILDFGFWKSTAEPDTGGQSKIQNPKSNIVGLVLPLLVVALLWSSVSAISGQVESDTAPTGFVTGMNWLRENSTPGDIIMTRDPWELNWHTGRKAVMIPNDDLGTIEQIARKYGVTMLQLGGPVDGIDVRRCPGTVGSRPALDGLYCGQERPGLKLLYRQGGLTIYRIMNYEL
jgi:hypothetical protein